MSSQGSNRMASPFKISIILQQNEEHLLFQYSIGRPKVSTFFFFFGLKMKAPLSARDASGITSVSELSGSSAYFCYIVY